MEKKKIISLLESLLFVSGDPVSKSRLADIVGVSEEEMGVALEELRDAYQKDDRGLVLLEKDESVCLATRPESADSVEKFIRSEREGALSRSALETLAIIAYREPISRSALEAIRGVNSVMTLRNLLLRGLIERRGNPNDARGYLYSTTFSFLEMLGIPSVSSLPDYGTLSCDERFTAVVSEREESDHLKQSI